MSQSDYLQHKKIATQLKLDNQRFNPVLESEQYTQMKQFQLENTITSTNKNWNRLALANKQQVFSMDLNVSNCTQFILCQNTDQRPHRVPLIETSQLCRPTPLTILERNAASNLKNECSCGSKNGNYPCQCSLGRFGIVR
jgi:hypothetical protein